MAGENCVRRLIVALLTGVVLCAVAIVNYVLPPEPDRMDVLDVLDVEIPVCGTCTAVKRDLADQVRRKAEQQSDASE